MLLQRKRNVMHTPDQEDVLCCHFENINEFNEVY